jgi:hypothetical protein
MTVPAETIRLLDELVRRDFQSARDEFFWWLIASTMIVIVGVALEGPDLVSEIKGEFRKFLPDKLHINVLTGLPLTTPARISRIKLVGLIGWLLVVIGVAGEGVFEGLVSKADGQLQTFNDGLLVSASEQAARASEDATDARGQAGAAIRDAGKANERAARSAKEAALANERASKNEKDAEGERLAREKLKNDITSQRDLIGTSEVLSELKKYPGTQYTLRTFIDPDSIRLTGALINLLSSAGWVLKDSASSNELTIRLPNAMVVDGKFKDVLLPITLTVGGVMGSGPTSLDGAIHALSMAFTKDTAGMFTSGSWVSVGPPGVDPRTAIDIIVGQKYIKK